MAFERDSLSYFVSDLGSVTVLDAHGKTQKLKSGDPEICTIVERAERVFYGGQWYSAREFERIVQESQESYWSY